MIELVCKQCGNVFLVFEYRKETAKFCSRRCKGAFASENYIGENNKKTGKPSPLQGITLKMETREKISKAKKGVKKTEEHKEKLRKALTGKHLSQETKEKIRIAAIRNVRTKEHCENIRKSKLGKKHPLYGKHQTEETRKKLSLALSGEKAHSWKGGISFGSYCPKFNREFKERVRAFFNYQCVECGTLQSRKRLDVHHVNFRKDACCSDEVVPLFVPLCHSCHAKTQFNRKHFEKRYTDMINQYYGGKCYLTKEEYLQVKRIMTEIKQ